MSTVQGERPARKSFAAFGANGEAPYADSPFGGDFYIYALVDPDDNTVRYVGQTTCPASRLISHMTSGEGTGGKPKGEWISSLKMSGKVPRMEILTRASLHEWERAEQYWIAFYLRFGRLYNISPGGVGNGESARRWHTRKCAKQRRKRSRRLKEFRSRPVIVSA